jgi:hypothetical protein
MNIYFKVLIMMFLAGSGAAVSLLVLGREIACQLVLNANTYISMAAACAAGAAVVFISKAKISKLALPELNMIISFSAITGVFVSLATLFFIRYYKVFLGIEPGQHVMPAASIALLVIAYLPGAVLFFTSLTAAETIVIKEKTENRGLIVVVAAAAVVTGSLVYLLFLWRYYTNIDVLYAMGMLVLAATYVLFRDKTMEGRWTMLAVITAVILYIGFNIGGFKEKADRISSTAAYKGYEILAEKEYPTIKFVMAKKAGIIYVFENGLLTYNIPDAKYTEMAKLARGKNIIIINGGAAGLIAALGEGMNIISYEYDPYTSYIMEKLYGANVLPRSSVLFKSGGPAGDFKADTVFINPREAGPLPYTADRLEILKKKTMAPGALLVISAPMEDKKRLKDELEDIFGFSEESRGFITAENQAIKDKDEK